MRKVLSLSIAAAALLMLALNAATVQAATEQRVVMRFENVGFGEPSEACPGGVATFDIVSTGGAPLGTGSSCIQSFKGCEPFFVGCRQKVEAIITLALAGADPIIVAAKLHEVVLDDDPFTLLQRGHGTVVNGQGQLKGGGTVAFTAEGIESSLVYVLDLTG